MFKYFVNGVLKVLLGLSVVGVPVRLRVSRYMRTTFIYYTASHTFCFFILLNRAEGAE